MLARRYKADLGAISAISWLKADWDRLLDALLRPSLPSPNHIAMANAAVASMRVSLPLPDTILPPRS